MFVARKSGVADSAGVAQAGSFNQHMPHAVAGHAASEHTHPEGAVFKIVAGYDRGRLNEVRGTIRDKGLSFHPSRHRLVLDPHFDVASVPVEKIATNLTFLKKREKEQRGHNVQPVVMVYTARIPEDLGNFLKEKQSFYNGLYTVPYKHTHNVTKRIAAHDLLHEDIYSTRLSEDGNYYTDEKIVSHGWDDDEAGSLFAGSYSAISEELWPKPKVTYKRIKTDSEAPVMKDSATQTDMLWHKDMFFSAQSERQSDVFPSLVAETSAEDAAWAQIDKDSAALPSEQRAVSPSVILDAFSPVSRTDSAYQSAIHSPESVEGMFGLDQALLEQWYGADEFFMRSGGSL